MRESWYSPTAIRMASRHTVYGSRQVNNAPILFRPRHGLASSFQFRPARLRINSPMLFINQGG
jgi:hypothetical protein